MTRAMIFDIDGTLADCTERLRHITGPGPKDWTAFFDREEVARDKPIKRVLDVLAILDGTYALVFCTGRPERIKMETIRWLEVHAKWLGSYTIMMRRDDDRRSSAEVKQDHLIHLRSRGLEPVIAFEDRAADAAMWRANGVTCFQVAEGAY